MGGIDHIALIGFALRVVIDQVSWGDAPTIEPTRQSLMPFGSTQAQSQQLNLIGRPLNFLPVQP
jgi:hypothetical protein